MTVSQCNFTNGYVGIQSSSGEGGSLAQLSVSNSQFNTYGAGQIVGLTGITDLLLSNNVFIVPAGSIGLYFPASTTSFLSITGNYMYGIGKAGTYGIWMGGSNGVISANSFYNFTTAVALTSSSANVNVQSNSYALTTNKVSNSGSANIVGGGSL